MKVDLTQIKLIHDLARTGATGCPEDLADRLGISTKEFERYSKVYETKS